MSIRSVLWTQVTPPKPAVKRMRLICGETPCTFPLLACVYFIVFPNWMFLEIVIIVPSILIYNSTFFDEWQPNVKPHPRSLQIDTFYQLFSPVWSQPCPAAFLCALLNAQGVPDSWGSSRLQTHHLPFFSLNLGQPGVSRSCTWQRLGFQYKPRTLGLSASSRSCSSQMHWFQFESLTLGFWGLSRSCILRTQRFQCESLTLGFWGLPRSCSLQRHSVQCQSLTRGLSLSSRSWSS